MLPVRDESGVSSIKMPLVLNYFFWLGAREKTFFLINDSQEGVT